MVSSDLTFLHLEKSYVFFLLGSGADVTLHLAHHFFFTKKVLWNWAEFCFYKEAKGYYSGVHSQLRSKECALELEDLHMNKFPFFLQLTYLLQDSQIETMWIYLQIIILSNKHYSSAIHVYLTLG